MERMKTGTKEVSVTCFQHPGTTRRRAVTEDGPEDKLSRAGAKTIIAQRHSSNFAQNPRNA